MFPVVSILSDNIHALFGLCWPVWVGLGICAALNNLRDVFVIANDAHIGKRQLAAIIVQVFAGLAHAAFGPDLWTTSMD